MRGHGHGRRFRKMGKWTVSRQAILDVFAKKSGHLTADDVYMCIRKNSPGMGIATVYRNLEFLREQGLLSKYNFGEGSAHYELNDDEREHHHHLICKSCGKVIDYSEFVDRELKLIKDTEKELSKKHKFDIESHELCFYGKCSSCAGR
ncbi:MAG: transcriptional repressor [Elusimicrobia bacterium]|nr:transcriptional repressor [Elusimicrobiota bacterium]